MSERSERVKCEEKFRISKRSCKKCQTFHFNTFFAAEGAMYHVAIATVIFSRVKITCYFHICEDIMFSRESSPCISLVFINIIICNNYYCQNGHTLHVLGSYTGVATLCNNTDNINCKK